MTYLRKNIETLDAYQPGEQPLPGSNVVKLNTNENCYPPSPAILKVLRDFDGELLRRYPDPMAGAVRSAASRVYSVPENWIMAANGSDESLALIMRAFIEPGRKVAYPEPTYSLYPTLTLMQDGDVVEVPYDEDYNLPVEGLIAAGATVTFVCTPNNPSGTVAPVKDLARLASGIKGILVVDEAYTDFADENALGLVNKFDNVIVLRTLSKGYSLAGLRLGLAVARPELLDGLIKIKDSYNVDALTCRIGAAAIQDQVWKNANVEKIRSSRARLTKELAGMGFNVWPSQSNFLLARPPRGNAEEIYLALKGQGILVRYWKRPRLEDKIRITVGTEGENAILMEALAGLV
jgi:histidinol-phosphate aminotransferase